MSEVLVVVEQAAGTVKKVTLEMLTLARSLGEPAAVVLGAPGSAAAVADLLAAHPAVARVLYPGRPDHPGHEIAARQMSAFGGMVSIQLAAGQADDAIQTFRDSLVRTPNDAYTLHGLAQALKAKGMTDVAAEVEGRFRAAWSGPGAGPSMAQL